MIKRLNDIEIPITNFDLDNLNLPEGVYEIKVKATNSNIEYSDSDYSNIVIFIIDALNEVLNEFKFYNVEGKYKFIRKEKNNE